MSLFESLRRARAVRAEAHRLVCLYARERAECGDPEGEGVLIELARDILLIPIGPRE